MMASVRAGESRANLHEPKTGPHTWSRISAASLARPGRLLGPLDFSHTSTWASVHRKCFEVTPGEKLEGSRQQLAQPLPLFGFSTSVGAFGGQLCSTSWPVLSQLKAN